MVRWGIPEAVPKNCGIAKRIASVYRLCVMCSLSSHFSLPNLLHLCVLFSGLCNAGLNGRVINLIGSESLAWESYAQTLRSWVGA